MGLCLGIAPFFVLWGRLSFFVPLEERVFRRSEGKFGLKFAREDSLTENSQPLMTTFINIENVVISNNSV